MTDTKFSKKDYEKYDAETKQEAISFLKQFYPTAKVGENLNQFGVDIIVKGENFYYIFEAEYKEFSNISRIKLEGLHISSRKLKFYNNNKVCHLTFLDNYKKVLSVPNKYLKKIELIRKDCKRDGTIHKNSEFIKIDFENCIFYRKENNLWR